MALETDSELLGELETKLKLIKKYFEITKEIYKKISIYNKEKTVLFKGKDLARKENLLKLDNLSENSKLIVVIGSGEEEPFPYILLEKSAIFFFDSYFSGKKISNIIDYPNGKRKPSIILKDKFKHLYKLLNIEEVGDLTIDDDYYLQIQSDIVESMLENKELVKPTYIIDDIINFTFKMNKGIMLLQMERGTGKTTLSRMLDELSGIAHEKK